MENPIKMDDLVVPAILGNLCPYNCIVLFCLYPEQQSAPISYKFIPYILKLQR